jgi:HlyD family secretion protein
MRMKGPVLLGAAVAAGVAVLVATGHAPWSRSSTPESVAATAKAATEAAKADSGKIPTADSVAPAVSTVAVTTSNFVETVLITGSVIARDEIMIAPEIEGFRVEELAAEEGDSVHKGQILARLTAETLDAQLAKNDADVARTVAAVAVARSGIAQAEATLKEATNAYERVKPLAKSGYASSATFDQRESAAATAEAKLVSARDSLKSAEADKAALEASRREITWRRSKSEIRSPVDGVVSRRTVRVGGVASAAGDALFRIIARGELELDAEVAESDMGKIHDGQKSTITVTGSGEVTGTVRLISSEVDKATRLGKVKVFLGANPALRLGGFGRGTIETAKSRGLSVVTSAVVYTPDGATVQVVRNGRVETRLVKVGLKTQHAVEILDGVAEGDVIVAKSGSFLRDGDPVRPVPADTKLSGGLK